MSRTPLLVVLALVAVLVPAGLGAAQAADPVVRPPDGALVPDAVEARAASPTAPVDGLTLDGAGIDAATTFTGEDFAFVFEGNGLNARYVNGIEVAGQRIFTIEEVGGFATAELAVPAELLHPGDNTITFFTGERPGTCNKDDFDLRNVRLRPPDGTEVVDPARPADEEVTLGDGTCGSNVDRPRKATWTFTLSDDAGSGPLGLAADVAVDQLDDGPHDLAATAGGTTTTNAIWTDATLVDPDRVSAVLPAGDLAAEQVVEAEDLLPPASQDIAVEATNNCCSQKFSADGRLLAGADTDAFDPAVDGSTFTLDVPVSGSGRYEVAVDLVTGPDHGIVALAVDGQPLGDAVDAHTPEVGVDRRVVFGTTELDDGMAQLTLTVAGANPAATGRLVAVDAIRLQPLPLDDTILSPTDGAVVRGQVPIVGFNVDEHPAGLAVDGANPGPRRVLGGESASLVFEGGGGNGLQGAFANRIEVRGQGFRIPGNVQNFTTDAVDVPGELLQPGENTITFVAGLDSGCNHDDFDLRNVRLELPDGTVLRDPTVAAAEVVFGDGICDDTVGGVTKALEYGFTFTIPEPMDADFQPGMGHEWDTTAVADGNHEIALQRRDGTTVTNAVVVDNTLPEILSTVPAAGDELKGTVTVAVEASDATSGVATTTVTVDGEPVEVGASLSSDDLADGSHEMVVTTADQAGNEATTTVSFTSVGESPDAVEIVAPSDGASDVDTSAALQVRAIDPAGDPLEVTFLEADLGEPTAAAAWSGSTASSVPADLASTAADPIDDVDAAVRPDDERLTSPSSPDLPFQRFDLPVPDAGVDAELEISWEGTVDAAREVVLSAWNVDEQAWVELDRQRGTADTDGGGDLRLQVDVTDAFVDGDVVHALVQGSDPFADDVPDEPDEAFRDPDTYDFSLAWMTDTQYLPEGVVEGGPTADRFAAAYRSMTDWIVDNAEERKIDYVAHTGDVINNWITVDNETAAYEQRAREEFTFASDTMAVLEDAGIPYGVTPGNHDNKFGTANALFNEFFPPSRFEAASETAEQDYFGGAWQPGDYHNHYDLFSAGGQDFVVVYLGFIADAGEIDWANRVLQEHADRNAIFATHEYLRPSLQPDGRDGPLSDENTRSQGRQLLEEVVLPNDNVFLTLSGHTHGVALNIRRDVGPEHRTVVEMLANYQFYTVGGERRTGHMRLLQFDTDRSEVSVNTYSPVLDDHNAEEFDTNHDRDYTAEADEFTVPVDLSSRSTEFATDAVYLAARTDRAIGTAPVAADGLAATAWDGLEPATRYGWYAVADDGIGGRTASSTATFTTVATPLTLDVAVDPPEPDGAEGWYTTPVTVTATPSDPAATVEVRSGDGSWQPDDDGVVEVTEDGTTTVELRAVRGDEATTATMVEVRLDATAPQAATDGVGDGQSVGDSTVLDLAATGADAASGVDRVELGLDGDVIAEGASPSEVQVQAWTLDLGPHELAVVVEDVAGNTTTATTSFTVVTSIGDLLAHVDRYADDSTLAPRTAASLRRSLELADRHLDRGRIAAARRQLQRSRETAVSVDDDDARELLVRDLDAVLADIR